MMDDFKLQNRAMDGDTVIIELLPTSEWKFMQTTQIGRGGITNETAVETRIVDNVSHGIEEEKIQEDDKDSDWEDEKSSGSSSLEEETKDTTKPEEKKGKTKEKIDTKAKKDFNYKMSKEERLAVLREVCATHRPVGQVIAIENSINRNKPIMITLKPAQRLTQKDIENLKADHPAG